MSKSGVFDFFVNSKTKEENAKIKNQIKYLQDDLEIKIQENGIILVYLEKLHMDIFDLRNNFESINLNLSDIIKNLKSTLDDKVKSIEISNGENNSLQQIIKNLEVLNKNIQDKHKKLETDYENNLRKWKLKKKKIQKELNFQDNLIKNNLPVKDYIDNENNSNNLNLYDYDLHVIFFLIFRKNNLSHYKIF